jgi:hypothetical protein
MAEVERRLVALLAALAAENARLQLLLASGRGLRWAERELGVRRVVV